MYSVFNPNPRGKRVGDCVIRAISKVLDRPWEDVYISLCIQGFLLSDLPSANAVWDVFLKNNGFRRDVVENDCPECYTIEDFANEHPKGVYVIGTGTHAVALVDGVVYDAWDSLMEQPIYFYVKENDDVRTE